LKKTKNKRALRRSPGNTIKEDWTNREVDNFLTDNFGYGLWEFLLSLYSVVHFFGIMEEKKKIKSFQAEIDKIMGAKRKLIEEIDQFFIKTGIWAALKRKLSDNAPPLTDAIKREYIHKRFKLDQFYDPIEKKIDFCKNAIEILKRYGVNLLSIRIKPKNFVILLWAKVMKNRKGRIDFKNIQLLLNWFLKKKGWSRYFCGSLWISAATPELTYNKYIAFAKNDLYDDLTSVMYVDCFVDIIDRLKRMFPNPFDYMKIQAEGIASIAKMNQGVSIGNKREKSGEDTFPVKKRTNNG